MKCISSLKALVAGMHPINGIALHLKDLAK